jgi:hypothetical protein
MSAADAGGTGGDVGDLALLLARHGRQRCRFVERFAEPFPRCRESLRIPVGILLLVVHPTSTAHGSRQRMIDRYVGPLTTCLALAALASAKAVDVWPRYTDIAMVFGGLCAVISITIYFVFAFRE